MTKNQRIEAKLARTSRAVFRLLRKTINLDSRLPFDFAQGLRRGNDTSVRVALVPNKELRRLKKKLLHKDVEIVDVLAFPDKGDFPHPESKMPPLGEVLVNEDIARRDFPRAVFLLTHGILHLLGYRHGKKRDSIVMEKLEKDLMKEI